MDDRLRRYLDGELELSELSSAERREAEAWEALFADARSAYPVEAPADLEGSVMEAVRSDEARSADRSPSGVVRLARWLFRPRPVPLSPAAGLAAAALLLVLAWPADRPPAPPAETGDSSAATFASGGTQVYVEFVLEAPEARSVAVAGDFTDWNPNFQLSDPDGDGVWAGRVLLQPGVHQYMFVIDGSEWVTDPYAERYTDDGFGNRNAVLAIAGS